MKIRLHQLAKELRVKVEDITSDMEVRSSPVLVGAGLGLVQLVNLFGGEGGQRALQKLAPAADAHPQFGYRWTFLWIVCSRAEISCARLLCFFASGYAACSYSSGLR